MRSRIIEYLKSFQEAVATVDSDAQLALAASCCERLLYECKRAVTGIDQQYTNHLAAMLDELWHQLVTGELMNARLRPGLQMLLADNIDTDQFGIAVNTLGAFELLFLNDTSPLPQRVADIASINLDQIIAMLHEVLNLDVTPDTTDQVDNHDLVTDEMNRQIQDAATLGRTISPSIIAAVRDQARGIGLFGDLWYP